MRIGNPISCWLSSEITHGKIQLPVEVENWALRRELHSSLHSVNCYHSKYHIQIRSINIFWCYELIMCQGWCGKSPTQGKEAMIGGFITNGQIPSNGNFIDALFGLKNVKGWKCSDPVFNMGYWQVVPLYELESCLKMHKHHEHCVISCYETQIPLWKNSKMFAAD